MTIFRRAGAALITACLLAAGRAGPALGADNVTVDAQVSIVAPCLTVSTTAIDFGPQLFSPDGGAPRVSAQPVSFANCGGANEQVYARGTGATETGGGASWALVLPGSSCPAYGLNRFSLTARASTAGVDVDLAPQDRLLDLVPAGSSGQFDQLQLHTPCVGSDGAGTTMSFRVIFTATF
jgi:hypothetical protein